MSTYTTDLPADDPVARLMAEIACHVLSSDGRAHLIPAILTAPAAWRMTRSPTAWRSSSATSW